MRRNPTLVSAAILNWNDLAFLRECIECVLQQSYRRIELLVIDNASTDGSKEIVRDSYPNLRLVENEHNLGFAGGHNLGIDLTVGDYYLPLNPDVHLSSTYIERLVEALEYGERLGMTQGKLLQPMKSGRNDAIDSTGIIVTKSRRNADRGHGEPDKGQYDRPELIFGAAGAAPLYRRAMLEDISVGGEYFDETFFLYREEVDLAWRAQWRGWRCRYVPTAVAYHVRSYSPHTRREQPAWLRRLQYRNRYLMVIKNDSLQNLLWHSPYLIATEVLALGYIMLAERELLPCYVDVLRHLPQMLRKRRVIMAKRRVSSREIRRWFR